MENDSTGVTELDRLGTLNSSAIDIEDLYFVHYLFHVLGIIITLGTLIGNTLVIVAVISEKKLRKVGNVFIVSLALSDCLVGFVVSPIAIVYDFRRVWVFGRALCDFWVSMDVVCCTASIMNLCAISYDRCNAILRPIQYSRRRTFSRAWLIVAGLWLYSALIALPPFLGWGGAQDNMHDTSACHVNRDRGYTLFSTIGAFYLPLCFMSYFYFKIYRASCSKKNMKSQSSLLSRFSEQHSFDSSFDSTGRTSTLCRCNCFGVGVPTIQEQPQIIAQASLDETAGASTDHRSGTIDEEKEIRRESIEPELLAIYQMRQRSKRNCSTVTESSLGFSFMSTSTDSSHTTTTSFSDSSDRSLSISTECSGRSSVSTEAGRRFSVLRTHRLSSQRHSSLKAEVIHELAAYTAALQEEREEEEEEEEPPTTPASRSAARRSDVDEGNDEESDEPHARQRTKKLKSSTFRHRNSRKRKRIALSQEKRAAKTLGIVMGCFILCWLPFFIVAVIRPFCASCNFHPLIDKAVIWLGYFNSACNPVIYTFFNKDFRHAFKNMACFKRSHVVHL